jgi:regulator of sigma E protease
MVTTLVAGLVMLGVLVVIHEFGHFIVAKAFGMEVPVFSVGMGPRVLGVRLGGTDYRLSALPVGGYVQLAGADAFGEEDADIDPIDSFLKRPVWQRLLVMLAGPVFNLLLPVVVFTAVLMAGEPQVAPYVGMVMPDSAAEAVGFRPGDRIVAVDGAATEVWNDLPELMAPAAAGGSVSVTVEGEAGASRTIQVSGLTTMEDGVVDLGGFGFRTKGVSTKVGVDDSRSPAGLAGLRTGDVVLSVNGEPVATWHQMQRALAGPGPFVLEVERGDERPKITLERGEGAGASGGTRDALGVSPINVFVGAVTEGGRAEQAGVRIGDRMVSVDGQEIRDWSELLTLVGKTAEDHAEGSEPRALTLLVARDGATLPITLVPEMVREVVGTGARFRPLMGVGWYNEAYVAPPTVRKYYGLFEAVPVALGQVRELFGHTLEVLGNLFTGELKPQETLGGPIEIFRVAGEGASRGFFSYVQILATISISLGIVNLLPIPVLDGGHIVLYVIEAVRGRPVSLAIREKMQMVGVLALAAVMLFVAVNDVSRWLSE